jgi:hypothetical protein
MCAVRRFRVWSPACGCAGCVGSGPGVLPAGVCGVCRFRAWSPACACAPVSPLSGQATWSGLALCACAGRTPGARGRLRGARVRAGLQVRAAGSGVRVCGQDSRPARPTAGVRVCGQDSRCARPTAGVRVCGQDSRSARPAPGRASTPGPRGRPRAGRTPASSNTRSTHHEYVPSCSATRCIATLTSHGARARDPGVAR